MKFVEVPEVDLFLAGLSRKLCAIDFDFFLKLSAELNYMSPEAEKGAGAQVGTTEAGGISTSFCACTFACFDTKEMKFFLNYLLQE